MGLQLRLKTESVGASGSSVGLQLRLQTGGSGSTADDVSRWLKKLRFSQDTIDVLRGKTALDLFSMNKEKLIELIGKTEGKLLFPEMLI